MVIWRDRKTNQLYKCVKNTKQVGGPIELYYNTFQDRVYTFLDDLEDRLDKIRSDVLQTISFPTFEQACAHVL
ncbi:hypothetical protein CR513_24411, partial [Mucuna pruriens]